MQNTLFRKVGKREMEVFEKVNEFIIENDCDIDSIAYALGKSANELKDMLTGNETMYADDLRSICIVLHVSPERFVDLKE